MIGKIAAVILIASGPGSLAISDKETTKILSECQAGLKFWSNQAAMKKVRLSFVMYYGKATISASNPTSCSSYASCHDNFANPTLKAFGFPTGKTGRDKLAQAIKNHARADGVFLAFFSKYRQSHFAYAYFGGGPTYMQYSNDGWGTDQIDRVSLMKLDMFLMLLTNTAGVGAPHCMAGEAALLKMPTARPALLLKLAAL